MEAYTKTLEARNHELEKKKKKKKKTFRLCKLR